MTDAIVHRGPDAEGLWQDESSGVALGHRRLSIVDLSPTGAQPMASASGRFHVVFNGEIYNFESLRRDLVALGATFRGRSDTEVLLAGVERWGLAETLRHAQGMFAFALWDAERRTLALARDRTGEKPLYWCLHDGALAFASELKALRTLPWVPTRVNPDALAAFLRFSYVPTPLSILDGVHKLEPGTWREFRDPRAATPSAAQAYWSAAEVVRAGLEAPLPNAEGPILDALDATLRTVIGEQMIADVPLGAFLSGGMDSSLVVGVMQALASRPVQTFTIGFTEARYNEADAARAVARHLGTDHTELLLSPDEARAVIPRLPTMYDEPFADSSQVPTHLVAALARQRVTVALSGDGGDEMFGGYTRYLWARRMWGATGLLPSPLRRAAGGALRAVGPDTWDWLAAAARPILPKRLRLAQAGDKAHKAAALLDAPSLDAVYDRLISNWYDGPLAVRGRRDRGSAWPSWIEASGAPEEALPRMQYRDMVGYLPDDILVKVDRAAMSVSLETRAPFLDGRLIALAARLPLERRIVDGRGKWALRHLLDRYVPRPLIDRPKQGFAVPIAEWLRGPLRSWAGDLLAPETLARDGLLDPAPIACLWSQHLGGARNHSAALWNVLMYVAWRESWEAPTG
jgi:asparagine synthase (glutamine-hydrolysing)